MDVHSGLPHPPRPLPFALARFVATESFTFASVLHSAPADSLGLPGPGAWMRDIILSAKSWFAWIWAAVLLAMYRLVIWSVLCPMPILR